MSIGEENSLLPDSESVGDKIKALRLERKMTLEDVAKKVGVGKSTVRKWETGMITNMRRDKILLIANALGTTPEYLMGWEREQYDMNEELAKIFAKNMKSKMQESKMSFQELEENTGISHSTLQRYVTGTTDKIPLNSVIAISEALHSKASVLLEWEDENGNALKKNEFVRIPVYGRIAAGIPIEANEEIIDYEEIPQYLMTDGELFGLQICGDSMIPDLQSGDTALIRKQPTVDNGQIAAVLIGGEEATLKKVIFTATGISLVALNPAYKPINFTNKEIAQLPVTIIGRLVRSVRKW